MISAASSEHQAISRSLISNGAALALFIGAAGTATAAPTYTVQAVQFPTDPTFTQVLGINNVGALAGPHGADVAQGFTRPPSGAFTNQNFPRSVMSMATAINGAGSSTTGIYQDAGGTTHGYIDIGGVFKTVDDPNHCVFNQALGINDSNTTVGCFALDQTMGQMGQSAYSQSNGVFTRISEAAA